MDNWSFLVTLLCAYAAIAWHLRLPDVLEAWKNFLTKAPAAQDRPNMGNTGYTGYTDTNFT